ncbi:hypothetical protein [Xenorhabdus indica]|nr:hypothetical protein [Xenorhabdus indica]
MTYSGRGKWISSRPRVGVQSAGGRHSNILAKTDTARRQSKAVGLA